MNRFEVPNILKSATIRAAHARRCWTLRLSVPALAVPLLREDRIIGGLVVGENRSGSFAPK